MDPIDVSIPGAALETARFAVEGMSCGGCAAKVQRTVSALSGVATATVDLAAQTATVSYYPERSSLEAIERAISALDYGVRALD